MPGGLAAGSHSGSAATDGDPSVVLLTLGQTDQVTWMTDTQAITSKNNCSVTFAAAPEILRVTPIGGQLGLVKDGLGVKSSKDGSGEPCGRVEAEDGEAISVSLGSHLDGYLMTAIDVDLELKFNAVVDVIFKHEGSTVHTLTGFTGTGGSDDGPDSGDGDNFRLNYRPLDEGNQVLFDEVVFDPSAGALSLEGGADGTEDGMLDPDSNSSQFEVVKAFDGQITCGDTVTITDGDVEEVVAEVTMQALNLGSGWDAGCTELKNYNDDVTSSSLTFAPLLEDSLARYTMELTIEDQPITTDGDGQVTSLVMEYSDGGPESPEMPLQPCLGQPEFTDAFFEQSDTGLLPGGGEFACYFGVSLMPTGEGVGTEVWSIYFEDDPTFSFR
ncbi:MAG: hypothetical protein ACRDWA_01280 [Acidimicrobiia bacterium]